LGVGSGFYLSVSEVVGFLECNAMHAKCIIIEGASFHYYFHSGFLRSRAAAAEAAAASRREGKGEAEADSPFSILSFFEKV
jgi:hypothetical protein